MGDIMGDFQRHCVKESKHKTLHMISFYLYNISRKGETIVTEIRSVAARGWV